MVEFRRGIELRFGQFVANLFSREGFEVEFTPRRGHIRADLLIHSSSGVTAVGEIKVYSSRVMPASVLDRAAAQTERLRQAFEASKSILIICSRIMPLARRTLQQQFPDLIIYDLDALAFLVAKYPDLLESFEELTREAFPFSEILEPQSQLELINIEADISEPLEAATGQVSISHENMGSNLCKDIQVIKPGPKHAKIFEAKVIEALRYIFDKDLTAWSPQQSSDTSLSFYDLVARVASEHDFWNTLVSQFRSRYVIFEFKNYRAKIKQGQIYTTEKYLFRAALRSTAIIISRTGADKNALAAARGALRESGKLIINLSVEDLCLMLHRKDSGDDPNALLLDRVDEMLMRLER
jgi:hypothetical protein